MGLCCSRKQLWQGVPNYLRELNEQLEENLATNCPSNLFRCVLPRGWVVTRRQPERHGRYHPPRPAAQPWKATDLFLKDIQVLVSELSMLKQPLNCWRWSAKKVPQSRMLSDEKPAFSPDGDTGMAGSGLKGEELPKPEGLLTQNEELGNRSTLATSHFRRVAWVLSPRRSARHPAPREMFRRTAGPFDIRQESTRHTEALGELTRYSVSATTKAGQRPTNRHS